MSDDESTQVIIEDVQSPWHKKMMEIAYREHEHAAKQRYLWTQRVQRLTPKGPLVIITAYQKLHLDTARKNVSHWRNIEQAAYERMTLLRDAYKIWLADRAEYRAIIRRLNTDLVTYDDKGQIIDCSFPLAMEEF